jgi:nucleoside-diphosphate-sugar epimerase
MRVFVTGTGGFIGKAVQDHLTGLGHLVVSHPGRSGGAVTVPEDADAVVNAAGRLAAPGVSAEAVLEANALLPELLGRQCLDHRISMIHISTPGVCGLLPDGREDSPPNPGGVYEQTKAQGEHRLQVLGLPADRLTILRPDFVFGAGDRHKLALFRQVARGWFPVVGREGGRTRPTHIRDVCRGVAAALPGGILAGGVFNIGGPQVLSMKHVAKTVAAAMERGVFVLPVPRCLFRAALSLGPLCPKPLSGSRLRLFGTDRFVSVKKAAGAGFTARHPFREAAEEAVSWYRGKGLL